MKYLALLLLFASCKEHVCPPPTKLVTHYDTVIRQRVDTLVIIQTYDSIPEPAVDTSNGLIFLRSGGWEMGPSELFKDGKRSDTIRRTTAIYY